MPRILAERPGRIAHFGYPHDVAELADWFLTGAERGNPASRIPAWCEGNRADPLVHGSTYFDHLITEVEALRAGDYLFFTDWRGDPDEQMRDGGPTVGELFCAAAKRGVVVKGLMWRSHLDKLQYSEEENQHLGCNTRGPADRARVDLVSGSARRPRVDPRRLELHEGYEWIRDQLPGPYHHQRDD